MSLSEVMSAAGLSGYAQIGFVICFLVFLAIVVRTIFYRREDMEARARAVLAEGGDGAREEGIGMERTENP